MRRPCGTLAWVGGVAFLWLGAFAGQGAAGGDSPAERLAIQPPAKRAEAPAFTLSDLRGKLVSLESFRGRVVLLNFWATWCGPCRVEMPSMERLYRRYKDRGLVVLGVNLGESPREVQAFVDELQLTFPVVLDRDGSVAHLYNVRPLPTTFFVGCDGVLLGRAIGARDWDRPDGLQYVAGLLAQPNPAAAKEGPCHRGK